VSVDGAPECGLGDLVARLRETSVTCRCFSSSSGIDINGLAGVRFKDGLSSYLLR
jgi:hypothetical protein